MRPAVAALILLGGGCADESPVDPDVQPVLARAARLLVDDDRAQCPAARYRSIQAAVDAAAPGETIEVCAGIYRESVRIDKTLGIVGPRRGIDGRTRTLASPGEATLIADRPFIIDADAVVLDGLTLRVVTDETGEGWGILTRDTFSGTTVRNCVLDAAGVTAFFPGSSGVLRTVAKHNHFYNRLGVAASSDEPYAPARNLLITENLFTSSSVGLFSDEDVDVVVSHNRFEGGRGISLRNALRSKVYGNTLVGVIGDAAIEIESSQTAWVSDNVLRGGAGDAVRVNAGSSLVKVQRTEIDDFLRGVVLEDATTTQVLANRITGIAEVGLFVDAASTGNRLADNVVTGSGLLDCQDEGTGNKWVRNRGDTSSPPGICTP